MKMIPMPFDQMKDKTIRETQSVSENNCTKLPADIEHKLLRQQKARNNRRNKTRKTSIENNVNLQEKLKSSITGVQQSKTREILNHLKEKKTRIKYHPQTGELEFSDKSTRFRRQRTCRLLSYNP